ncbi:MAG: hypothetical protein ABSH35_09305 [Isosphaeraceae bacterium]|jgi:hypothetical protein
MSMLRVIRSTLGCAGHWIGETYCAVSQKIAERIEKISDTIAEQRHLAERPAVQVRTTHVPSHQVIDIRGYRVVNGHRHLN